MKVLIENNQIANIYPDSYISGNPTYDNSFIPITSYASDIDMKDVQNNKAWKFKIVDGELQYDQDKIKVKLNNDIIRKRQARYIQEVDPLTLEAIRLGVSTIEGKALKEEANKRVEQIKKELPKEEITNGTLCRNFS